MRDCTASVDDLRFKDCGAVQEARGAVLSPASYESGIAERKAAELGSMVILETLNCYMYR